MKAFLYFALLTFSLPNFADTKIFSSDEKRAALIELFTSEGCHSCPPADKWLAEFKTAPNLWSTIVPVAFHVDYWDYIGWKDRFASKKFSNRQRRYASEYGERTVYTPGVRVGGEEFRAWRQLSLKDIEKTNLVGVLNVEIDEFGNIKANFDNQIDAFKKFEINFALLGMNLSTEVKRGENKGVTLHHDFVALEHFKLKPKDNNFTGKTNLKKHINTELAVAVWVNPVGHLIPIQATGGYL